MVRVKLLSAVFVFFSQIIAAQNSIVFDYAQRLAENDASKEASLEFKRYLFLENDRASQKAIDSCRYLSSYYDKNDDCEHAVFYIERAINYYRELELPEIPDEIHIQNIKLLSKLKKDEGVERLFSYTSPEYTKEVRSAAWKAVISLYLSRREYAKAQSYFETGITGFNDEEIKIIRDCFEKLLNSSPKNPKAALVLSFIPGLGQAYAAHYSDACNAFLLNGSLIALSAWSIATANYSDFFYFELSPLFRFYRGNLYNAQKDTYEYNDALFDEILKPVYEIINLQK